MRLGDKALLGAFAFLNVVFYTVFINYAPTDTTDARDNTGNPLASVVIALTALLFLAVYIQVVARKTVSHHLFFSSSFACCMYLALATGVPTLNPPVGLGFRLAPLVILLNWFLACCMFGSSDDAGPGPAPRGDTLLGASPRAIRNWENSGDALATLAATPPALPPPEGDLPAAARPASGEFPRSTERSGAVSAKKRMEKLEMNYFLRNNTRRGCVPEHTAFRGDPPCFEGHPWLCGQDSLVGRELGPACAKTKDISRRKYIEKCKLQRRKHCNSRSKYPKGKSKISNKKCLELDFHCKYPLSSACDEIPTVNRVYAEKEGGVRVRLLRPRYPSKAWSMQYGPDCKKRCAEQAKGRNARPRLVEADCSLEESFASAREKTAAGVVDVNLVGKNGKHVVRPGRHRQVPSRVQEAGGFRARTHTF